MLLKGYPGHLDHEKVLAVYRIAVKMNWKVLTVVQFVNIKYVPQQVDFFAFRFKSMVSWLEAVLSIERSWFRTPGVVVQKSW